VAAKQAVGLWPEGDVMGRNYISFLCIAGWLLVGACAKGGTSLDSDGMGVAGRDSESSCGNVHLEDDESCDGHLLRGETCESLGYGGGTLTCDPSTCTFDTQMCTPKVDDTNTSSAGTSG
jgi:hypothetical protein